jgi:hypothetical protein
MTGKPKRRRDLRKPPSMPTLSRQDDGTRIRGLKIYDAQVHVPTGTWLHNAPL